MKTLQLLALLALSGFTLVPTAWGATAEETINTLIPKLAAPNMPDRYAAQMELQQMAAAASKPGAGAARTDLGKLLAAKAADAAVPQPARVWIIRQLEYMGGAEAVSALTRTLSENDAELRECARRALEKNPSPEAGSSLRAALGKGGDANWKIGLINALGQRHDAAATSLIIPHLDDAQTIVTAALSLGRIATPPAVTALWKVIDKNAAVADALVVAANRLDVGGKGQPAKAIYQRLYQQSTVAVSARAAALTGLAKVDAVAATPLILQALSGTEASLQNAAIVAAPVALGKSCSSTLAQLLPRISSRAKTLVLNILDASAENVAAEAAKDADGSVRMAAIDALGRMGGALSVPILFTLAASDVRGEKSAAETALSRINGAGAGATIEHAASAGDSKTRVMAMNVLVSRKQISAMPVVLRGAEDADEAVRQAAFSALGRLAGDADVDALVNLASKGNAADAYAAINAAAQRAQDKPAAAKKLLAFAKDEATQTALINAWSALGGAEGLSVVTRLAASANADTCETAIKTLGNWPDISAAKPLLALAADTTLKDDLHRQALQAIARLVKSSENEPAESLADAVLAAMRSARQDDETKLVLSALAFVPHPKAVEALKPMLASPQFKAEAGQAGIALAELLVKTNKAAGKELAQAVKEANVSPEITRRANRVLNR